MGSPDGKGKDKAEKQRDTDEAPHEVCFSRDWFVLKTEVTQAMWEALMGTEPWSFKDCGPDCPVEKVSWFDAVAYTNRLSAAHGLDPCYDLSACSGTPGTEGYKCTAVPWRKGLACTGFRLPTEAEWEYMARAGTRTRFSLGDCVSTDQVNFDGNYPAEGCDEGKYRRRPVPAGSLPANAWGLNEVHGNVWEWCWDRYGQDYGGDVTDPLGKDELVMKSGSDRVGRGGSWYDGARACRAADRGGGDPGYRNGDLGFRPARSIP
jgi:formylglycine-generating enzyme required for sulfatase activity